MLQKYIVLAVAALVITVAASAEHFIQTVECRPGMAVKIDYNQGDVDITGIDAESLAIDARGEAAPTVTAVDSLLTISYQHHGTAIDDTPRLILAVPRRSDLQISLGVGSLALRNITGTVRSQVRVGNASSDNLSGVTDITVSTGNIEATWDSAVALPASCILATSIGDISASIPQEAMATINATTGLGRISGGGGEINEGSRSVVLGSGDRSLVLSTKVGNITIDHSRDRTGQRVAWHRRTGEWHHHYHMYFGAGGGPLMSWPDRSYLDFNANTSCFGYPAVEEKSYAWGGEGYVQFGRFRIGGMGWGNQLKARTSLNDTLRYVTYDYGFGGLTLEYVVLRADRFDLSLGAMLGGGSADIRLAKAQKSDITWDEAAALNTYREVAITTSGYAGMPIARMKLKLWSWLSLQVQAGFLYSRISDWQYRQDQDLFNTPRLDASGWTFAIGPHFGF